MAEVRLEAARKTFGETVAVSGLDLAIADGEFVVLLGPTGAGKTTTLRMIAGLERLDGGRVVVDGRDATAEPPAARDVSFVFQQYSLYPHLSVFDNLAFPLRSPAHHMSKAEIDARVRETAALVRIDHKLENRSTALSGGEMQRVAIGRALVRRPAIFLMDEPLSSLDAKLRADLRVELKRISRELGATILYVTHDQTEAMTMADRVGILADGHLLQIGTPREIYENPNSIHVAARLGQPQINVVPVNVVAVDAPPEAEIVGLRTEHLEITPEPDGAARVERIEHLGDQNRLHLRLGRHPLVMLADGHMALARGETVSLRPRDPLFFDREGLRVR